MDTVDYLTTGADLQHSKLAAAPAPLLSLLATWTLPFLWIGLTMSIRRALDAGWPPWFALLFLVQVLNYGVMALSRRIWMGTSTPAEVSKSPRRRDISRDTATQPRLAARSRRI